MKRWPRILVLLRKMTVRGAMKHHFTPTHTANLRRTVIKSDKDGLKSEPSHMADGNGKWRENLGNSLAVPQSSKHRASI